MAKRILMQNSTHKAVKSGNEIKIYTKGFKSKDFVLKQEFLYSIPLENEDDLMSIFDNFDEENRINMAELNLELSNFK